MHDAARNQIRRFLSDWVNSPDNPKFAVMLEGRWGCGKTHFIQQVVSEPNFTRRKTIYLSLFGISNLQDFERQLFYAGSSNAIRIMHQGVGFASSLFSGAISIGSGGMFSGSADIGKAVESTLGQVTKAADAINEALVIIDDLERCSFDQSELLGVLNRHIEHGNSRVILVANTQRIDNDRFAEFREKVIGQTFEIPPDPKGAVDAFIAEMSESAATTLIVSRAEGIQELYRLSGFNNLRAVRQFFWFLAGMLEATDQKLQENEKLIDSLITQAFIFFMEFKLNLGGPENSLTPIDLLPEFGGDDPELRSFFAFKMKEDTPDTPKLKVLKKYNIINGIQTAITIHQWIDILNIGTVDADRFNAELAGAPEVNGPDSWPSWKRLWHIWSWDFSDGSATEFNADIDDIRKGIEEGRYKNPHVVMHVVGVTLMLLDEELIEDIEGGWVHRFKLYIDEIVIPALDLDSFDATRWSFDSGYDNLGYARREKSDFIEVLDHLKQSARDWYSHYKAEAVAGHLIETLKSDYFAFLGDLVIVNGKGDQRFLKEPILQTIDVDDFVNAWLSLGRQEEHLLTRYFDERYDQVPDLILTEGPWWQGVANAVLIKIDDEPAMPRKAQLQGLVGGIERLIDDRLEKARLRSLFVEPICKMEIDLSWTLSTSRS
ncbi:KAP family P-loop domain protein [Roseivivax jejudonensis]|uniref:KAP family P-loop domain protein n=1 Tax=Roseivivax jejudonensis TaxID=1529041 RepID=A0A1X6Y3W8_9RHOB|nr:P-loop NTPase fold protein [Roseivivax jejudonensis]SLN09980.1 KAP family P-loop domain protein [Roseivivax jejudonensis]